VKKRNQSYLCIFEKWEIETVEIIANKFERILKRLRFGDYEDLMQESFIHWLKIRDKYDPNCYVSEKTYMSKAITNWIIKLCRKASADKRRLIYESESECTPDQHDSSLELNGLKSQIDPDQLNITYKIDLSKVFQKLNPEQIRLCNSLIENNFNILRTSHSLKRHKSTLYREIQRIKELSEKEGLTDYFK